MSIVSDNEMKEAAEVAAKERDPSTDVSEFFEHVPHAQLRYGRTQAEARALDLAIAALQAQLQGAEEKANADVTRIECDADAEIEEIRSRSNRRTARIREDFVVEQTSLKRRIDDLVETREMLEAQINLYQARHPKQDDEKPSATADR